MIAGLIKSFRAVGGENIDPSQKARILAERISEAMNCTAFAALCALIGGLLLLAIVVVRRRARAPSKS
jgi:hypothetical protein